MKAKYVKPAIEVMEMETEQVLCASNLTFTNDSANKDYDVLSKPQEVGDVWGFDDDDDE